MRTDPIVPFPADSSSTAPYRCAHGAPEAVGANVGAADFVGAIVLVRGLLVGATDSGGDVAGPMSAGGRAAA